MIAAVQRKVKKVLKKTSDKGFKKTTKKAKVIPIKKSINMKASNDQGLAHTIDYIEVDGIRLRYLIREGTDNSTPLFLINGIGAFSLRQACSIWTRS